MRTEYFMRHLYTPAMRQFVVDLARSFMSNPEDQEDLVQEAWMRIAEQDEDRTVEFYRNEAKRAMASAARRRYRELGNDERVVDAMTARVLAEEPVYGRPVGNAARCRRYKIRKKSRSPCLLDTPARHG